MTVSCDDIQKLATLARLELTDEELEQLATEIGAILGYIEQLNEVDVAGVEPTNQVTGLQNVLRPDSPDTRYQIPDTELARLAPVFRDGYVVVPAVFDRGNE